MFLEYYDKLFMENGDEGMAAAVNDGSPRKPTKYTVDATPDGTIQEDGDASYLRLATLVLVVVVLGIVKCLHDAQYSKTRGKMY